MRVEEAARSIPIIAAIDYDRFRQHCDAAFVRRRQPPESFFTSSDIAETFGFVVTGRVKLTMRRASGGEATLDLVAPGNLLCMSRPYACLRYCCDAVAHEPNTRVLIVRRDRWLSLMSESKEASRYFVAQLGARGEVLCRRVEELSTGRVEQRLCRLLLRLAEQLGEVNGDGIHIRLSLSRRDLADLAATTPESVTRVMRRLEKSGVVQTRPRVIIVHDVEALEAAVGAPVGD